MRDRIVGGVLGLVVGDALGVPVEFSSRQERRADPVTGMRGFGTHNQPPGTWSDDSSMALATLESLLASYSPADMVAGFRKWFYEGYMTPHGRAFDIGRTTREAIMRSARGTQPDLCGGLDESDNGNGSLMRILPLALHSYRCEPDELARRAITVSALTHGHDRAKLCCIFYCLVVKALLEGQALRPAMAWAGALVRSRADASEAAILAPILDGRICDVPEKKVLSGGYVVETLGASLWCCANHSSYREIALAAVNLGGDTDTTGAVAGGLAGVIHGSSAIPADWISDLAQSAMVVALAERLASAVLGKE